MADLGIAGVAAVLGFSAAGPLRIGARALLSVCAVGVTALFGQLLTQADLSVSLGAFAGALLARVAMDRVLVLRERRGSG